MKVLIIGYGSAGKQHEKALASIFPSNQLFVVTRQEHPNKVATALKDVKNIQDYHYFVIASKTNLHYEQLSHLCTLLDDKVIFCEKPLFEKSHALNIKNNQVYIGYLLRYHPLIQKLKTVLFEATSISANFYCGQYLPTWRPTQDYTSSYSASKSQGGGVLLDLSHELDLAQWLFGNVQYRQAIMGKYSNLHIDSEDILQLICKTETSTLINISLDYLSRIPKRFIIVHTQTGTHEVDLMNHTYQSIENDEASHHALQNFHIQQAFEAMHRDILNGAKQCCSFREAVGLMQTIDEIREHHYE